MSPIPPWSDLAPELLSAIAKILESNPIDILRFRFVCKSWYSSVPSLPPKLLSPLFPLTIPSPPFHFSFFYLATSCALSATTVCILRPPNGVQFDSSSSMPRTWIAFIDQLNPGFVSIRRPFSGSGFLPLDFPRKLNLLDFHVSEIGRYYSVNTVDVKWGKLVRSSISPGDVDKVVVFSNGSGVVVLFREGKLGLLRLGVRNDVMGMGNEWQMIHDDKDFSFDDIVDFKGRMLGIDCVGRLYEMRYYSLELNVIVTSVPEGSGRRKRLIESLGLLYLVVRYDNHWTSDESSRFKVYVLNEAVRKWVEVASIGDRIFIFGLDFSMSTLAEEFEGSFEKNCIIFTESSFRKYSLGFEWLSTSPRPRAHTVAVYHLKDGTFLYEIESSPGYSCILWPPPTWLWLNNKLKLLGTFENAIERLHEGNCDENLKAKHKEFSPSVGAVISGDVISQGILNMVNQADMLNKFLNMLVSEIDKDSTRIKKDVVEDALSRHPNKKFLLNQNFQGRTSSLVLDNWNYYTDSNCDNEYLTNEMPHRLGAHMELKVLLKGIIRVIEENTDKVNDSTESRGQASVSAR